MSRITLAQLARDFAIWAHGDQKYGDHPYVRHLDDVAKLLENHGDLVQAVAYLHDVLEDTVVTRDEIAREFGPFVAECVEYLTDAKGTTRSVRKIKTNAKLAQVPDSHSIVLLVKLADRLCNVAECQKTGDSRLSMYRKEQRTFADAVYREGMSEHLWVRLQDLLNLKEDS